VSVLAYIDGSQFTESVLFHAAWAARQLDTGVTLVHVLEYVSSDPAIVEDRLVLGEFEADERRVAARLEAERSTLSAEQDIRREILMDGARELRERGVERVRTSIEYGTLEEHIREHGAEADVVVIGKRGELSPEQRGRLGDHLERVIRASRRPILIAPSEAREIRRFLIAFDGGHQAGNAIRFLVEHPLLKGCEGTLMLAGDQAGLQQQLDDAASHLRSAGYAVQAESNHGRPDRIIPDILNTEDIDLLVMGGFSHPRLHAMLGRSTTLKLLRSSTRAILVVR
jgi:nucleotide-binding universal stress UspA family protein